MHHSLRYPVLLLALVGCAGGGDDGEARLTAPVIATNPEGTAASNQDVTPVIVTASEGAANISYQYFWTDGELSWPQEVLPASVTTKGETWTLTAAPFTGDLSGPAGSTTIDIVNGPPVISAAAFSPSTPTIGVALECLPVGASDPDGDAITFSYLWERGGTVLSQTSNILPANEVLSGEAITCTVTPNDGEVDGTSAEVSGTATNAPPTSTGSEITPTSPRSTDDLTCSGIGGTDADGDTVTFTTFSWTVDGVTNAETGAVLSASQITKDDLVTCTAHPFDGEASGTGVVSPQITVGNGLPVFTSVSIAPTSPETADTLTCTPVATDPDGDGLTYTYEWRINGTLQSETSNFLAPGSATTGDSVTCTAIADDGTETVSLESDPVSMANAPPEVFGVNISPSTAHGLDVLTCGYASTSDADGHTVTVSYAWTVDGTAAGTGSTLPARSGSRGDVVQCVATPNDSYIDGTAGTASLTFGNAPPDTPTVSITETSVANGDSATCSASASDVDGDSVSYTYTWFVNNTQVGTGASLSSVSGTRGQTLKCEATATDGTATSAAGEATLAIANTPPTLGTPVISNTSPREADTVSCVVSASDVDGDSTTISYRWVVAGTQVATDSSITGSVFDKDESIVCHATPDDGYDAGTEVSSAAVTAVNTAPAAPGIRATPSSVTEGQSPLRCEIVSAAFDPDPADQGNLTYIADWLRDGTVFSPLSSTSFSGDTIATGDVIYGSHVCQVTAEDLDGAVSPTATSNTANVVQRSSLRIAMYQPTATGCDHSAVGESFEDVVALLTGEGHTVSVLGPTGLDTLGEMSAFDVLLLPSTGGCQPAFDLIDGNYVGFLNQGGGLVAVGWNLYGSYDASGNLEVVAPFAGAVGFTAGDTTVTPNTSHPIGAGVGSFGTAGTYATRGTLETGATPILSVGTTHYGAAWGYGNGRSVYLGPMYTDEYSTYQHQALLDGTRPNAIRFFVQAVEWSSGLR